MSNKRNFFKPNSGTGWLWGDNVSVPTSKTLTGLPEGFLRDGIYVKSDGTKVFFLDDTSKKVVEYVMSTAHDVSTAVYNAISPTDITINWTSFVQANGLFFNSSGDKCYIYSSLNDYKLYEHTLSTPWDVTTLSNTVTNSATFTGLTTGTYNRGYQSSFSSDGTLLFFTHGNSSGNLKTRKYLLNTAWNISTINNLSGENEITFTALTSPEHRTETMVKIDPENNFSNKFVIINRRTVDTVLKYRFDQHIGFIDDTIESSYPVTQTGSLELPSITNRNYLYTIDGSNIFRKYVVTWP